MLERVETRYLIVIYATVLCVTFVNIVYENSYTKTVRYTTFVSAIRQEKTSPYRRSDSNSRPNNHHGYLLPDDVIIDNLNDTMLTMIYWRYINTIQFLCTNQTRVGSMKDGGKEMCIDEKYRPRKPCLVYSFGSNYDFNFEKDMMERYGCEVHTFDPSMEMPGILAPSYTKFHKIGLAEKDYRSASFKWQMRRLSTIIADLQHKNMTIEVLKVDIEGDEWRVLPEIIQSGELQRVRQLCIEIHFGWQNPNIPEHHVWGNVTLAAQLKVLRKLHNEGFRIFMREHNTYRVQNFTKPFREITNVNELSLVNINLRYGMRDFDYRRTFGDKASNFDMFS